MSLAQLDVIPYKVKIGDLVYVLSTFRKNQSKFR